MRRIWASVLVVVLSSACEGEADDSGDDYVPPPPAPRAGEGEKCGYGVGGHQFVECVGALICHPVFGVCESSTKISRRCCDCMWELCESKRYYRSRDACANDGAGAGHISFNGERCTGPDIGSRVCPDTCYMFEGGE